MLCLFFNLSGLSGLSGASIVVQDSDAQNGCHLHCTGERSRCYAWCIVPEHSARLHAQAQFCPTGEPRSFWTNPTVKDELAE